MAIFNKLAKSIDIDNLYRFGSGDWQTSGVQVRPKDTRTAEQLCKFMDGIAEKHPELKEFVKDLKTMNPKHLNLAADTMELATTKQLVNDAMKVDMNAVSPVTGKSLTQFLLGAFPKASRENPHALEFMQEVINNTDRKTIEYVLLNLTGVINKPQLGEHFKAVKPLVKDIAEQTIGDGFPVFGFEKQENFMQFIRSLVNRYSSPEKISALPKLLEAVDKIPSKVDVELNKFTMSKAPLKQVEENIDLVPEVVGNALNQNKQINVVDFVNNNVNLY